MSLGSSFTDMLAVEGLTKRFGSVVAIDDVTFEVRSGEVVGFLGPNGAGKTTTMRAIMHLVALDSGRVSWNGRPVTADVRRRFGYMPAERGMYARMRVRDHLVYQARLAGRRGDAATRPVDQWLERLGLVDRARDTVQSLSSGNQQRVQLAMALVDDPELLVLDEPFSGLDPLAVDVLSDVLRERVAAGAALLLSSHQLDLVANVCTAVVIVDRGRIVLRGDVSELRAAATTRYVDVEFSAPTVWRPRGGDAVTADSLRYRLTVGREADPGALLADARDHGAVTSFAYAPPDLSEVFLSVVGRDSLDTPPAPVAAGDAR